MKPIDSFIPEPVKEKQSFFKELLKFAFIALIIVLPIRYYIAQPFIVSGESMYPTFDDKDYLIVDQLSYKVSDIARGDVIVFHPPTAEKKYYIKRVIGLPGETVVISGSSVTIKNATNPTGFTLNEPYIDPDHTANNNLTFALKSTQYFVMGDNRSGSYDSRTWGPLEQEKIIGRPLLRLFPVQHIELFPGEDNQ